MVHTRSLLEPYSRSQKDQSYWDIMKELSPRSREMNRQLRGLSSSSSSSSLDSASELGSNDFHPDELQNPIQLNEAFIEQMVKFCPIMSGDKDEQSYMSDGEYSTSSETQVLMESARIPVSLSEKRFSISLEDMQLPPPRRELPFRESRRSLALRENPRRLAEVLENESESSLSDSTSSGDDRVANTSMEKRKLPFRKSRSSPAVLRTLRMSEESELSELSFSDRSVCSNGEIRKEIEKEKQFMRQLNLRHFDDHNQNESESDSETDKIQNSKQVVTEHQLPRRNIRTPVRYESFDQSSKPSAKSTARRNIFTETSSTKNLMLTRSRLAQSKSSEKNRNDDQIKTTPIKSTILGQKLLVKLNRADVTPELLRKAQSKNNFVETLEESNAKTIESHDDIETLLQALEGSSSSDSESNRRLDRVRSPIKSKSLIKRKKTTTAEKPKKSRKSVDKTTKTEYIRDLVGLSSSDSESDRVKSPIKRKKTTTAEKSKKSRKSVDKPTKTKYICHVCQQCFTSMESLKDHDETHSAKKIRKCEYCEKTFTRKDEYGKHRRQHQHDVDFSSRVDKAFKCDICKKRFSYRHVLRRHERMHENRAEYKCKQCDERFVRQDYLRDHERLKHSKNPYFSCQYCDKQFSYKHRKEEHERAHRDEKPFKCRFCNARFNRKEYAKKHQLNHEIKIAKYTCDECDDTFVNKFTLQQHVQKHLKLKEAEETEDYIIEVHQLFINDDF
ncbi:zinc finger protein 37-like [Planococcus citri]|uniref:zinc finger protein 37-like n=1 Tax=Planococcus citri TaxID=170843 RepID=UPI0031F7BA60